MGTRLRLALLVAGIAVSTALTYFALRDIDFGAFADALGEGDPGWLAASFAAFVAAYAIRVARWWVLFAPEARPPIRALVRALLVGEFLTSLLPALRPGELARVVVLNREAQTPRSLALGTVVTERLHDAVALLLLLFVAVPFAPGVTWLRGAALLLAALGAGLAVALLAGRRFGTRPLLLALRPLGAPRAEVAAAGIVTGLLGVRRTGVAAAAFALSMVSWLGVAVSFALALRGVGLELGLDAGIVVAVATTFSLLLPALPASVGVFEAAALVALEPYAVDDARALSGAVVIHVLSFVPFLVAGPLALRGHAAAVGRARRDAADPPPRPSSGSVRSA